MHHAGGCPLAISLVHNHRESNPFSDIQKMPLSHTTYVSLQPATQHHSPKFSPGEKFFRVRGAVLRLKGYGKWIKAN